MDDDIGQYDDLCALGELVGKMASAALALRSDTRTLAHYRGLNAALIDAIAILAYELAETRKCLMPEPEGRVLAMKGGTDAPPTTE